MILFNFCCISWNFNFTLKGTVVGYTLNRCKIDWSRSLSSSLEKCRQWQQKLARQKFITFVAVLSPFPPFRAEIHILQEFCPQTIQFVRSGYCISEALRASQGISIRFDGRAILLAIHSQSVVPTNSRTASAPPLVSQANALSD